MEAVVKQRRSVIKRQKKSAAKLAAKTGPVKVHLNNVPTSDRKMRLVANLIRGKEVNQALSVLKFQAKQGAARLEKLLVSAMADWEAKRGKIDETEIVVKDILVTGGKILKRLRPAPQGRAHRVRKRSNHVTLILDSSNSTLSDFISNNENVLADFNLKNQVTNANKVQEGEIKNPKSKSKKNDNK